MLTNIFRLLFVYYTLILLFTLNSNNMAQNNKKLSNIEKHIIIDKGTEAPVSGIYNKFDEKGTYVCKQCGSNLYKSSDKFSSNCGWPSFDDEIEGAVKHIPDADGIRKEIVCANCNAHLGHVFLNEAYTSKNVRHCVNSISLNFIPDKNEIAYYAGGCFWGIEYFMKNHKGVISIESGYIGGAEKNPSYDFVCSGKSNYAEAVKIIYDPAITNFEELTKRFFEIHDPTQLNRQGPDIGEQYRSEIFYTSENQKIIANKLIKILKDKGYNIVTKVSQAKELYKAEKFHQDYYKKNGAIPYCHKQKKLF
jgi:peptide methionine sulfoxide reductase msrA/msrB